MLPQRPGQGKDVVHIEMSDTDMSRAVEELWNPQQEESAGTREELEQRVEDQTAELAAAVEELESFAYSVSHDLRAPLRAITGFSRILLEEHADHLDAEGRRMLEIIDANVSRMGQLIDGLLRFSRLGRAEMERKPVDLTALVGSVVDQLALEDPDRDVKVVIRPLGVARCDHLTVRQVLANLIGNAWKFTRHEPDPVIEVGRRTEDGQDLYYVSDNGVGFDERYAAKLFGMFQRLHRDDEFEGHGIGLAIANRVIQRHGGRLWAVGRIGAGAEFRFTLGEAA